jgi:hypothetical protein
LTSWPIGLSHLLRIREVVCFKSRATDRLF